jgi:hypothetical protein
MIASEVKPRISGDFRLAKAAILNWEPLHHNAELSN